MALTPEQYYLQKGESIDAYNTRIASLSAADSGGSTTGVSTSSTGGADAFLKTLQDKLLASSNIVSSEQTGLESAIQDSIKRLGESQTSREVGIKAGAERSRLETKELGAERLTGALESQRGVGAASQMAVITRIEESTTKSLRDLDLREQEALASGQIETADKIANLKFKEIQFRQESRQQAFNNLLSLGSFGLGIAQEQRLKQSAANEERRAMVGLGLEFGVQVGANDTFESVASKAMGSEAYKLRGEEAKLRLEEMRANISRTKAETNRVIAENGGTSDTMVDLIAQGLLGLPKSQQAAGLLNIKDGNLQKAVSARLALLEAPKDWTDEDLRQEIGGNQLQGDDYQTVLLAIQQNPSIQNKDRANLIASEIYRQGSFVAPKHPAGRRGYRGK